MHECIFCVRNMKLQGKYNEVFLYIPIYYKFYLQICVYIYHILKYTHVDINACILKKCKFM